MLATGWARVPALEALPPKQGLESISDAVPATGYTVDQMRADLDAILSMGRDVGMHVEIGSSVESVFATAHEAGLGQASMWAVYRSLLDPMKEL